MNKFSYMNSGGKYLAEKFPTISVVLKGMKLKFSTMNKIITIL